MWEQLRLSNHAIVTLTVGVIMLSMANHGSCITDERTDVDDNHTTNLKHGLYEIREEGRKFIAVQNSINHTNWVVSEPSLKTLVPRCVVPLKVKWVPKSYGLSNKSIMVYCTKALSGYFPKDQWDVAIPVFPPQGSDELPFNIREAAVTLLKQTRSRWEAGYPNTDSFVGKCLVPLDATMNKNKSAVNVTCKKPLQTFFFKGDSWTVPVPISR